ncbi:hypothetical protein JTB14_007138 [Gonioctena quinquepunctata]|nr:hypothetical protein JTB14_007138 [Gonioctena quinquepunctata]
MGGNRGRGTMDQKFDPGRQTTGQVRAQTDRQIFSDPGTNGPLVLHKLSEESGEGQETDNVRHTQFSCPRWTVHRLTVNTYLGVAPEEDDIISNMTKSKENWRGLHYSTTSRMEMKEKEDRERQGR